MRKLFSERTLVIILFVAAFIVFGFAQEETRKQERLQMNMEAAKAPTLIPAPQKNASLDVEQVSASSTQLR